MVTVYIMAHEHSTEYSVLNVTSKKKKKEKETLNSEFARLSRLFCVVNAVVNVASLNYKQCVKSVKKKKKCRESFNYHFDRFFTQKDKERKKKKKETGSFALNDA